MLSVTLTAERKVGVCAVRVQLDMEPRVLLARAPSVMNTLRTPQQPKAIRLTDQARASDVRWLVIDYVDRFMSTYHEQNPDKQVGPFIGGVPRGNLLIGSAGGRTSEYFFGPA